MAVQLVDNFDLSSKKPLDSRAYWETLAALQANRTILMPNGFLAYVEDKKCYYIMSCTNASDPSTYTWSEFKTGSTGGPGTAGPTYTPGDNIQISADNKISATDTKYTLTADKDNPMKIDLTNAAKADDKQSVEIPIHYTGVEGYPTPVGTIIAFMGKTAPQNYLACDGSVYKIADYKELADFIKAQFGKYDFFGGDGTTTFAVPQRGSDSIHSLIVDETKTYPDISLKNFDNLSTDLWSYTNNSDKSEAYKIDAALTNVNVRQAIVDFYVGTNKVASYSANTNPKIVNDFIVHPGETARIHLSWPDGHTNDYMITLAIKIYRIIFPYIKYRSDTVLNNVYSTDETIVGRWIDGKPIYRKVWANLTQEDIFKIVVKNIDTPIKMYGYGTGGDADRYIVPIGYYDGATSCNLWFETFDHVTFQLQVSGLAGLTKINSLMFEYTKTTDDANTIPAGSNPSTYTEYSTVATDEEVNLALQ